MTGTAIAPVPARTLLLCPSKRFNTHPCNARPDLYPTGGPPLDAGLIHGEASDHLARFIRGRLQESGCEHPAVAKDALLHTNREERTHSGTWAYTRPSILAYKFLRADREPANAFHLGYDGPPDLVVEILSASTGCKDMGVGGDIADKTEYYRSVGVSEYWIYNPELRQQQKRIRFFTGYALQEGRYVPMQRRAPDAPPFALDLVQPACKRVATCRCNAGATVGPALYWERCGKKAIGTVQHAAQNIRLCACASPTRAHGILPRTKRLRPWKR